MTLRRRLLAALALALLPTGNAAAHGINGHVHVTGWAVESLPPGELRDFFADPDLRDTAQIGAGFPDSGYAIGDPYGEMAHWEPFINAYVEWIKRTFGPDYDTEEARRHIAFMMGAASHGLQDELFDTLFLRYLIQEDGEDQDAADSGTDAFLFTDGILEFKPPLYIPETGLPEVFQLSNGYEPTMTAIRGGMQRVKILVIDHFDALAPGFDAEFRPRLPWGSRHYLDPDVPGSLRSEIQPTAAYMQALWDRLHGRFGPQAIATHSFPTATRRLRSVDHTRVDSRIGIVFGIGAIVRSLNPDTVQLVGPGERPVLIDVQHTRWSGSPGDSTRQVVLVPMEDLVPDTEYEVRLQPGIEMQNGELTSALWTWRFKTPCPEVGECSPGPEADPLDPPRVPYPPPPDAGVAPTPDAALPPVPDAAPAPTPDAATPTPVEDADLPPAIHDAGTPVVVQDAAPAPQPDAGNMSTQPAEGCAAVPGRAPGFAAWGALLAALGLTRRLRRRLR